MADGPFNLLLRELSSLESFVQLVKLQSADENNATREELVLEFFAYLNDRENFKGAVDKFLTRYMETNRTSFDVDAGRVLFKLLTKD